MCNLRRPRSQVVCCFLLSHSSDTSETPRNHISKLPLINVSGPALCTSVLRTKLVLAAALFLFAAAAAPLNNRFLDVSRRSGRLPAQNCSSDATKCGKFCFSNWRFVSFLLVHHQAEGFYCDIVSGERVFETTCTGDKYRVYDNHFINVLGESRIHRSRRLPMMAVHEEVTRFAFGVSQLVNVYACINSCTASSEH